MAIENIVKIFTSDDIDELRIAFKEMMKEHFKEDLENFDMYWFDPNRLEELVNDAFKELIEELKDEYRDKLRKRMEQSIDMLYEKINKI